MIRRRVMEKENQKIRLKYSHKSLAWHTKFFFLFIVSISPLLKCFTWATDVFVAYLFPKLNTQKLKWNTLHIFKS